MAITLLATVAALPARAFAGTTGDVVIEDEVQRGGLKIRKLLPLDGGATAEGDTVVEGTQFTVELAQGNSVYVGTRWYSVGEVICTITSGADGWATTPNNYLPYGTYTIRESRVNEGQYKAKTGNSDWYRTVAVHSDKTIVDAGSVTNDMWRGTLSVNKRDYEHVTAQGDASLANAVFTCYNRSDAPIRYRDAQGNLHRVAVNAAIPDKLVTDANGYAEYPAGALEYGTYEVVETTPPHETDGTLQYLPQNPAWSSGMLELRTENMHMTAGICSNKIVRGGLRMTKYDLERDAAKPQGDGALNAEFSVYNRSPKPVIVDGAEYAPGEICYVLRADRVTGAWSASANTFPYGTYEVVESAAATGYHLDPDWSYTFSVRSNGSIYSPAKAESNKNKVVRGGIQVIKLDADSNESIPQGDGNFDGIEITITNASTYSVLYEGREVEPGQTVCTITMTDGVAHTTRQSLPYGRYKLRETNVPQDTGYRLNPAWNPTVVISEQDQWATVLVDD